jgi:hypothetical protein
MRELSIAQKFRYIWKSPHFKIFRVVKKKVTRKILKYGLWLNRMATAIFTRTAHIHERYKQA